MAKKFPLSSRQDLNYLGLYWGYLREYRVSLSVGILAIPLISLFHLLQPVLLKRGIDEHILKGDLPGVYGIGFIWGLCLVMEFGGRTLQAYLFHRVGIKTVTRIRRDLLAHLLSLSPSYFDRTPAGTLVTRATSDIEALNDSFSSGVITLLSDLVILLGVLVAMLWLSPRLTLATLIVLPLLGLIVDFFRRRLRSLYNRIRTQIGRLNAYLREQLEGVVVVQLMQREARNHREFVSQSEDYKSLVMKSVFFDSLLYSVVESMSAVMLGVVIWYGFGLHQGGAVTLGLLIAFLDYTHRFFNPLKDLSGKFATLQAALAALEKIFGTFSIRETIPDGDQAPAQGRGHLVFEQVSFAYPGYEDKPVLKNVSFEMRPGEVVAVVGPTGSGKTTISRLIGRLYRGYEGRILLDGVEIGDWRRRALFERLSIVSQDVALFSASLSFNLTLGNPRVSPESVAQATARAHADRFVEKLPQAYDTPLLNRGQNLSSGQAQQLSLARALARETDVILLDEATASVDSLSEKLIQDTLERLFQDKTVLVIAHRLSTIQKADRILAMKEGEIVESGTHPELMALGGFYAKLFNMQFAHL